MPLTLIESHASGRWTPPGERAAVIASGRRHTPTVVMLARIVAFVACLGAVAGCADASRPFVRLSDATGAEAGPPPAVGPSFRVAVGAMKSPQATLTQYEGFLAYLGEQLDRPVELVQRRTYAEVNELLRTGDAALGFVCSGAYVQGRRAFGMELLVVPEVHHETTYYSYIIVPNESTAGSLNDLRGHSFAFTDPLSNSGYLAPLWRLRDFAASAGDFFVSTTYTYSHDNSIRAVADRIVDGAAIDSLVYEEAIEQKPNYRATVRVIEQLGPYPNAPVVVHPQLAQHLKEQLRALLLGMAGTPEGRGALSRLRVDRFVTLPDSAYDTIHRAAVAIRGDGP